MRAFSIFLILLATVAVSLSQGPVGEEAPQEEADTTKVVETVRYSADTAVYMPRDGQMILRSDAQVEYKDIVVNADLIRFDSKSREIFAEGSPILISGADTLYGERMGYHLDTRRGFVERGRSRIEKGWFTGKMMRLVGEKTLNVDWGTFTTCDHDPPHYYFIARRMKVYANDMVVCEPVIMVVRELPVLAVPFWFFPIKRERHSGFLVPKVGRSSTQGRYVQNIAYYWAINDYSDLTVDFDYFEKKGLQSKFEGVYLVKPFLSGHVTGSFIDEIDTKTRRWSLYADHKQTLPLGMNLSGHADILSDASYNVDYEEERLVQLNKQLDSYLGLKKSWSGGIGEIVLEQTKDLQTSATSEKAPEASFSLNSRPVFSPKGGELPKWYHSLYFSYRGRAINSREKEEDEWEVHQALDNFVTFKSPQKLFTYFTLSPSLDLRETVYGRDRLGNRYARREHYTAKVNLSTVIYGLSRGGVGIAEQFRHVLKPSISYSYAPEGDTSRYYEFGGIGGAGSANRLSVDLGNEFQVKLERGGEVEKFDLATVNLGTAYNFEAESRRLSDIRSTLEVNPTPEVDVTVESSHDPYTGDLASLDVTSGLKLGGRVSDEEEGSPWRLDLEHRYVWGMGDEEDAQQLWGKAGLNLTRNWRVDYGMRYDITTGTIVDRSLRLYRDLHCWEADFTWSSYGEDWRYDFKIRIKAIPEIRLGKGVFGILAP